MDVINIYTDIDSILDVRTGALVTLYGNEHNVVEDLLKVNFKNRLSDDFNSLLDYVDNSEVKKLLDSKSVEVLRNSIMTSIIFHILEVGKMIETKNINVPMIQEYCLTLDLSNYNLNDDEIHGFKEIITHMLPSFSFKIVNLGLLNLTPAKIRSDFDVVFLYDLNLWLGTHSEALATCNMPAVYMFAPAIYYGSIPTEEETIIEGMGPIPPFTLLEKFLVEFLSLQIIDGNKYTFIDV